MHGIGKIAARMTARRLQQSIEIGMASAALPRDARELGFGNAGRMNPRHRTILARPSLADGPIDCHSSPLVLISGEALLGSSYRKGVKTRFMGG
jgi:hypothetical protein